MVSAICDVSSSQFEVIVVTLAAASAIMPIRPTLPPPYTESTVPSDQGCSHFSSGTAVPGSATLTGAAENAASLHRVILKFRFRPMTEIRVFGSRRRHFGKGDALAGLGSTGAGYMLQVLFM